MENKKIEVLAKANIRDKDLVELGFPKETTNYTFNWQREESRKAYRVVVNFYNALYTLAKIYEKYTSKKLALSQDNFTVYLDDKRLFSFYDSKGNFYDPQNIQKLKDIVRNLIPHTGSFENLKREFAKIYAEEKAKTHLSGEGEIYNWNNLDEQEKKKFIEALKSDVGFAEKPVYRLIITGFFGDKYLMEVTDFKLEDILNRTIASIRIYQNLLIIQVRKIYAVKLSEAEKQKVLNILTLLKL